MQTLSQNRMNLTTFQKRSHSSSMHLRRTENNMEYAQNPTSSPDKQATPEVIGSPQNPFIQFELRPAYLNPEQYTTIKQAELFALAVAINKFYLNQHLQKNEDYSTSLVDLPALETDISKMA